MRNVVMIRREPGLVSIPVEKAVYCETVKQSRHHLGGAAAFAGRIES
ncbi:MAG: hypothetical protein WCC26_01305 [Terracidiphilus sp.]